MKYKARKPFRYGAKVYLPGQQADIKPPDVVLLQRRGCIGAPVIEAQTVAPAENAARPKPEPMSVDGGNDSATVYHGLKPEPEPKHVGGGWYEYDGRKMRKKDLPS